MAEQKMSDDPQQNPPCGNASLSTTAPPAYVYPDQNACQQDIHGQSVQYMLQGAPMPITAYPPPPHPSPHSFVALVLFTLAFCLFLNVTTLAFSIPALVLSIHSVSANTNKQWKKAERYGRLALYFTMATWLYVGIMVFVVAGIILAYT